MAFCQLDDQEADAALLPLHLLSPLTSAHHYCSLPCHLLVLLHHHCHHHGQLPHLPIWNEPLNITSSLLLSSFFTIPNHQCMCKYSPTSNCSIIQVTTWLVFLCVIDNMSERLVKARTDDVEVWEEKRDPIVNWSLSSLPLPRVFLLMWQLNWSSKHFVISSTATLTSHPADHP